MQIVNGYVCATGCDVAAAKRGHDPKNPHDDPVKAAVLNDQKALAQGKPMSALQKSTDGETGFAPQAVTFGGALAGLATRQSGNAMTPQTRVDLLA